MAERKHTLEDAVVVFRALDRRHAAVLLSQLDIADAQLLLAAVAKRDGGNRSKLADLLPSLKHEIDTRQKSTKTCDVQSIELLLTLRNRQIKTLLASVSTAHWAPALSQASDEVTRHVLNNVAPPVAKMLSAEIVEFSGGVQAAVNAQTNIVAVAKRLRFLKMERPRKLAG